MSDTAEILREHLGKALWDTCTMVGIATVVGVVFGTALAVVLFFNQSPVPWHLLPALGVLALGCTSFVAMAGAFAVCLKPAAVAALMTVAVILSFVGPLRAVLPDIHRFWLVDAFAGGCTPAGADLCAAAGAGALLVAFWLVAGSALLARREIP